MESAAAGGGAGSGQGMTGVFRGVAVALVTVFDADGEVDAAGTAKLAGDLVERGMRAVLVSGTTGEAATLSPPERAALVGAVRAAIPPDVPVLAGTGAPSARQAASLTRDAVAAGADAVLAWPPPGSRDLPGYFAAVAAAAGGRPVLAYHNPFMPCAAIPVDLLGSLPVAGQKDSSGSPDRLLEELAGYPGGTYVGSAAVLALAGPLGAAGALLALANLAPEECVRAFAGDAAAQRGLTARHLAVRSGGIPALKEMMATASGLSPVTRI